MSCNLFNVLDSQFPILQRYISNHRVTTRILTNEYNRTGIAPKSSGNQTSNLTHDIASIVLCLLVIWQVALWYDFPPVNYRVIINVKYATEYALVMAAAYISQRCIVCMLHCCTIMSFTNSCVTFLHVLYVFRSPSTACFRVRWHSMPRSVTLRSGARTWLSSTQCQTLVSRPLLQDPMPPADLSVLSS